MTKRCVLLSHCIVFHELFHSFLPQQEEKVAQWHMAFCLPLLCNKPQKRFLNPYSEVLQSTGLSSSWLQTSWKGKNCRGLSLYSGCFDFQCLANWDGFILSVANISRYSIHQEHSSSLIIVNVNPYFRLPFGNLDLFCGSPPAEFKSWLGWHCFIS